MDYKYPVHDCPEPHILDYYLWRGSSSVGYCVHEKEEEISEHFRDFVKKK